MAEFCRKCAEEPPDCLGEAWIAKAPRGKFEEILCEGCGWVWVDEEGNPVSTPVPII